MGAPYDIAPFDNIAGSLTNFYDSVADRCGSPSGGSGCLSVVESRSDDPEVEECIVRDISYSPPPGPPEAPDSEKKLQRGTKVTVQADCPPESPAEETGES